eukprot:m.1373268 g.1373268  ORF g.1373268 m.1373268 type:complete len:437 (-) comp24955_c1_seq139:8275-9585(-)
MWDMGMVSNGDIRNDTVNSDTFIPLDQLQQNQAWLASQLENGTYNPTQEAAVAYADLLRSMSEEREGVCVTVVVRLEQEITVTRTAFKGELQLSNSGVAPMTNISVKLNIWRADDTSFSDVSHSAFVLGDPVGTFTSGVNGQGYLDVDSSGTVEWLFMALPNATSGADPTVYAVGGTLQYFVDDVLEQVQLFPAYITVLPDAELDVKYFWQEQIFSDDPFTPDIEPSVPFSVAMMVHNRGFGSAKNFEVLSAQPQIVENEKGLAITFQILDVSVNFQKRQAALGVAIGDVVPSGTAVAWWRLTSSLSGSFIAFNATVVYNNPLGDPRLSLIQSFSVYSLVRVVRDFRFEDNVPDFLSTADDNWPNVLHSSKDNAEYFVSVCPPSNTSILTVELTDTSVTATIGVDNDCTTTGWLYMRISDPWVYDNTTLIRINRGE